MSSVDVQCAWCGRTISSAPGHEAGGAGTDARVSHGVCLECLSGLLDMPLVNVLELDREVADALPFGRMELAPDGTVLAYNRWEAELSGLDPERVAGRNFFRSVAPCILSTEFEEHWERLLESGAGASFEFLFAFPAGHRLVEIRMLASPDADRRVILVRDMEAGPESAAVA